MHRSPELPGAFPNLGLCANIRWIMEKAREFQKNIYFCTGFFGPLPPQTFGLLLG